MAALQMLLGRAQQDAGAARVLARGADSDVRELGGEFRAFRDQNNRLLSAMREDLTDLRTDLNTGLAAVRDHVDRTSLKTNSKIDGVAAAMQVLTQLLTRPEEGDEPEA